MRDLKIFLTNSKGKALAGENQGSAQELLDEDEFNVPDEVETVLEELFKALRDKDTIVRYSAAKGVARVSERLPVDFTEQVLEQVLQLFSIHSIAVASIYDMPSIAEVSGLIAAAVMTSTYYFHRLNQLFSNGLELTRTSSPIHTSSGAGCDPGKIRRHREQRRSMVFHLA